MKNSSLGITPVVEGGILKVRLPKPTKEYRDNLINTANQFSEKAKLSVRNVRKTVMDKIKKLDEDEGKRAEKQVNKLCILKY